MQQLQESICLFRRTQGRWNKMWPAESGYLSITSLLREPLLMLPIFQKLGFNLEKAMATHSSTLAWKIPWMEEPGGLQSMGSLRVGHDWVTSLSLFTFMHWRRKWQPTPVFLPGESQGRQGLVGCRLWGCTVGHDWSDLAAAAAGFNWWWVETCFLYSSMTLSMRQVCGGLLMAEMPCNSHCQIGLLFSLSNQKTFFKNLLNWSIITWQYCDGFCHASVWIGHRYTWPPILNPPPASLPTLSL